MVFSKSVDKKAVCWLSAFRRHVGMCIETENGGKLDFDTPFELLNQRLP